MSEVVSAVTGARVLSPLHAANFLELLIDIDILSQHGNVCMHFQWEKQLELFVARDVQRKQWLVCLLFPLYLFLQLT